MNSAAAWAKTGALWGFLAVLLGAFGAHGLERRLSEDMLKIFETGVRYQMYHALALLALAGLPGELRSRNLTPIAFLFNAGIFIFSGSLYILALTGVRRWGMVTPLGGICFLAAWLILIFRLTAKSRPSNPINS